MTDVAVSMAAEQTATSVVNMNIRQAVKQKILNAWKKISDPIKNWFARRDIGSEKGRQSVQDAVGLTIWAACWVGVSVALRMGFQRSVAAGATVMFLVILALEYAALT